MRTGTALIFLAIFALNIFCSNETQFEKDKQQNKNAAIVLPIMDQTRTSLIPPPVSATCRSGYTSFVSSSMVVSECIRCHRRGSAFMVLEDSNESYDYAILFITPGNPGSSKFYKAVTGSGSMVPFTSPGINQQIQNWINICRP